MAPQTGSALVLLVVFVLPGFITVLLQERTFKSAEDPTPFDRLLRTLYYSVWCFLLLAVVALVFGIDRGDIEALYDRYREDPAHLVWRGALAALVPPILVANATRLWAGSKAQTRLLTALKINARHEQPTGWDYFFRQRANVYVRVTKPDGSRILGFYGSKSFAAYAKDGRDLFLERVFIPDKQGWFGPEAPMNRGVWVRTEDAVAIEFYNPDHGTTTSTPTSSSDAPDDAGSRPSDRGTSAPADDQPTP